MQHCPPEIWQEIIDRLPLPHESTAIRFMSLVSRSFTPMAQAKLFRRIILRPNERSEQFLQLLHQNPAISSHIRYLEVWSNDTSPAWNRQWFQLFAQPMQVWRWTLISSLSVAHMDFRDTNRSEIETLFINFTLLESLFLRGCEFDDVADMFALVTCFHTSLQHLGLYFISWPTSDLPYQGDYHALQEIGTQPHCSPSESVSKLVSLSITLVPLPALLPWLFESRIARQLHVLDLAISSDADVMAVSVLLAHGCSELRDLILKFSHSIVNSEYILLDYLHIYSKCAKMCG
jgi:hypothetical protein